MAAEAASRSTPRPPPDPSPPRPKQEESSIPWRARSGEVSLGSARSPQESAPWPLLKLQNLIPTVKSQYKVYEDAFVEKVKEGILLAREHPVEVCGVAVAAGFILLPGPRRFLLRQTIGRFKTEKQLLTEAELRLKEFSESVEELKKDSTNILKRTGFGEEHLQRGSTNLRSTGRQIQRLVNSTYKVGATAEDLMHRLRTIPGRDSLELRAEQVASMASDLKNQRRELQQKIVKISELGIRV
ncbi:uncharacterized protein LOC109724080 isoform X1 [Ananas comosus]|uniref:Uncharacterized protein LOC109724080 isoform X1 n=1 Tax=Ananas comosus TaxID=4615 RepID=A0A6P5GK27_ANACO|nr:uncharacterized protein LOC109724080 isoform X1 [Ananas comosus]